MRRHMLPLCCALGVTLMLAACSGDTKYRTLDGGADPAAVAAAEARAKAAADRADAAEMALDELRASLAAAQAALTPGTTAQQREQARDAVMAARADLAEVQKMLAEQPASDARDAANAALAAVNTALGAVDAALGAALEAMGDTASAGPLQLATMHPSLDTAQAALDTAQVRLGEALEANPSGALRNLLAQAQATLTTAQVSLVPLLREELADALARVDRLTMAFGKDLAIDGREASRVTPADDAAVTLTPRRQGVEWSALAAELTTSSTCGRAPCPAFDATSPSWGVRTRYTIEDYGDPNPDRLEIARDAVPYEAGGAMVIPGNQGALAMNEFPGRGEVFRGIGYDHREFQLPRQGSYGPSTLDPVGVAPNDIPRIPLPAGRTGLRGNLRGHAISSFQYRQQGGLTMKFGALPPDQRPEGAPEGSEGSLIYGDLEALTAKGTYTCGPDMDQGCDEAGTRDLTVSFGAPSRDPRGEPNFYWTVDVPDARLTLATGTTASLDESERAAPDATIGRYEMVLSNHAGMGQGDRYLRYAAYGLFQFVDYQTTSARPGRMQTFHYGFDAFGQHNPLPAATADSIAATLNGRTMAWLATTPGSGQIDALHRMRGHVTLHACIGGSGCQETDFIAPEGAAKPADANALTGAIHDLEITLPGGAWGSGNIIHKQGHNAFAGDILLRGEIAADGAFDGTLHPDTMRSDSQLPAGGGTRADGPDTHGYTIREQVSGPGDRTMSSYWLHGGFEGVFYGPVEALEAAGTWWLPTTNSERDDNGIMGMIGSFGVIACSDSDTDC